MEYRNLGRAGVKVSPLWLGTAYFNTRISEEDGTALITRRARNPASMC